jgi:hypothetical protein
MRDPLAFPPKAPEISSPCVDLCRLESPGGPCAGCGRTAEEIAAWLSMDEKRRREIMAQLPARRATGR